MSRFNIELPDLEMCKHCEGRGFVLDCKDLCAGADFEDDVHSKNCYRMCSACCSTGIADNFPDEDEDDEDALAEDERLIDEMYRVAGIARPSDEQLLDDMYRIAGLTRHPLIKEPPCPDSRSN